MTYGYKGEYAQSAKLLHEVLNKHPNITWAYRQLAFVSAMAGDLITAREAMKKLRLPIPARHRADETGASSRRTPRVLT